MFNFLAKWLERRASARRERSQLTADLAVTVRAFEMALECHEGVRKRINALRRKATTAKEIDALAEASRLCDIEAAHMMNVKVQLEEELRGI